MSSALFIPLWARKLQPLPCQLPPSSWAAHSSSSSNSRRMDTAEKQGCFNWNLSPTAWRSCGYFSATAANGLFSGSPATVEAAKALQGGSENMKDAAQFAFLTCLWVLDFCGYQKRHVIAMFSDKLAFCTCF